MTYTGIDIVFSSSNGSCIFISSVIKGKQVLQHGVAVVWRLFIFKWNWNTCHRVYRYNDYYYRYDYYYFMQFRSKKGNANFSLRLADLYLVYTFEYEERYVRLYDYSVCKTEETVTGCSVSVFYFQNVASGKI